VPRATSPVAVRGIHRRCVQISAGGSFAAALDSSGRAWLWGREECLGQGCLADVLGDSLRWWWQHTGALPEAKGLAEREAIVGPLLEDGACSVFPEDVDELLAAIVPSDAHAVPPFDSPVPLPLPRRERAIRLCDAEADLSTRLLSQGIRGSHASIESEGATSRDPKLSGPDSWPAASVMLSPDVGRGAVRLNPAGFQRRLAMHGINPVPRSVAIADTTDPLVASAAVAPSGVEDGEMLSDIPRDWDTRRLSTASISSVSSTGSTGSGSGILRRGPFV